LGGEEKGEAFGLPGRKARWTAEALVLWVQGSAALAGKLARLFVF
jgi:hypothetical protein